MSRRGTRNDAVRKAIEELPGTVMQMHRNFIGNLGRVGRSSLWFVGTAYGLIGQANAQINGERTLPADPTQSSTEAPTTTTQAPSSSSTTSQPPTSPSSTTRTLTLTQTLTDLLTTLATTTTEKPTLDTPPDDEWEKKYLLALLVIPVGVAAYLLYRYCRPHERVQVLREPVLEGHGSAANGNQGQIFAHSSAYVVMNPTGANNPQARANDAMILNFDDALPGAAHETIVDMVDRPQLTRETIAAFTDTILINIGQYYLGDRNANYNAQQAREQLFAERVAVYQENGLRAEDLIADIRNNMAAINDTIDNSREIVLAVAVEREEGRQVNPGSITDMFVDSAVEDLENFQELLGVRIQPVQARYNDGFETPPRGPSPSPRDPVGYTPGGDRKMIDYKGGNNNSSGNIEMF